MVEEVVQLTALYAADTDEEEEGQEDNNTAHHAMEEEARNCFIGFPDNCKSICKKIAKKQNFRDYIIARSDPTIVRIFIFFVKGRCHEFYEAFFLLWCKNLEFSSSVIGYPHS